MKKAGLVALMGMFTPSSAWAKVDWSVAANLEFAVAIDKDGATPLPTVVDLAVGMTAPLKGRVSWYTELSVATPITTFTPAPRIVVGPAILVTEKFVINPTLLYQLNPYRLNQPHGGNWLEHTVGAGVNFVYLATEKFFVGLVVGASETFGGDAPTETALVFAPNAGLTF